VPTAALGEEVQEPVEGVGASGSDTEEAIEEVPTYEDSTLSPFAAPYEERVTDSFFRIAQDFLYTSEIGARTVGHVPLWPRGPLKLGPVLLFPYVTASLGWTSNVYQDEDEDSSWYASAGGGLAGEYIFLGGRGSVTFGADLTYRRYFTRDDNATEWVTGIGIGYKFPRNWWIRAGVKWEHLSDPIRIEDKGELERDQIYPYLDIGVDEVFGNKINIEAGIDFRYANYEEREFKTSDRREWDFHLKVSYPFLKDQTRIYVRYDYTWADRRSRRINDQDGGHQLSAGVEGLFNVTKSGRLRGFIEFGYRRNMYDGPNSFGLGTDTIYTDDDDAHGILTVGAGLEYLMGAKTSVDLRYLRDLEFSASSNYQVIDRLDLGLTHNITRCLLGRLAGFFEHGDPSEGSSFTRYGAGLGFRYVFDPNIDFHADVDWSRRNTSKVGYDHSVVTATLGATYYIR
jgi:hypothetical protein